MKQGLTSIGGVAGHHHKLQVSNKDRVDLIIEHIENEKLEKESKLLKNIEDLNNALTKINNENLMMIKEKIHLENKFLYLDKSNRMFQLKYLKYLKN